MWGLTLLGQLLHEDDFQGLVDPQICRPVRAHAHRMAENNRKCLRISRSSGSMQTRVSIHLEWSILQLVYSSYSGQQGELNVWNPFPITLLYSSDTDIISSFCG